MNTDRYVAELPFDPDPPVKVNALSFSGNGSNALSVRRGDPGSVILCRMNNGAVFRIFGLTMPGHSNWYRVHGSRGAMETTRGPGQPPPSILGFRDPVPEAVAHARKVWQEMGYTKEEEM